MSIETKEYADVRLHQWDASLADLLVFLPLSSCQLDKSILTIIKIRSLLCTLQVTAHHVLHIFIDTVQGHRSRELQKCRLWSSN